MTVPPGETDAIIDSLTEMDGVITLSVQRGESIKPPGDVINASVLNDEVDAVLERVLGSRNGGSISVATSSLDSLIDTDQHVRVRGDVDEATWDEAETAMRRHTRQTVNFYATNATGGVIAACALLSRTQSTEAVALVAAAIIAPAFDPLVRIGLAITNRRPRMLMQAVGASVAAYVTLIVVAILTMLLLRSGSHHFVEDFLGNTTLHEVRHPPAINLIISACGAIAGAIMVSAGRFTQLAGPLVALQLLPAAAAIGIGIEIGNGSIVTHSLGRLAIDIGMVLVASVLVFAYKHATVHQSRRTPL